MSDTLKDIASSLPTILAAMKEHGATKLVVGDITIHMGATDAALSDAVRDAFYGPADRKLDERSVAETMKDPDLWETGEAPHLERDDGQDAS